MVRANQPLISVIVPVYKVEKYLNRCVDSIIRQTYKNIEIILVDDGSPDACPALCDALADKDDRVRVIHKTNGGLSSARNAGLDVAKGEYIGFVDSDDAIAPDMYEHLYKILIDFDADVSICEYANWDGGGFPVISEESKKVFVYQRDEMLRYYLRADQPNSCFEVWDRLYSKKLLQHIRFTERIINEDVDFSYKVFCASRRVCFSHQKKYWYNVGNISITRNALSPKDFDLYTAWKNVVEISKKNCESNVPFAEFNLKRVDFTLLLKYAMFGIRGFDQPKQVIKEMQAKLKKNCGMFLKSKGLTVSRKIAVLLLCVNVSFVKCLFDKGLLNKKL